MFLTQDPNNCRNQSLKRADDLYDNIKVKASERPIIRMNGFCHWKMVYWPTWPPKEPSKGQDGWPDGNWSCLSPHQLAQGACVFQRAAGGPEDTRAEDPLRGGAVGRDGSHAFSPSREPRHSTEPWDILQQGTSNNSEEQMNKVLFAAWGFLKPYIQGDEFWKVNHFWSQWQDLWPTSGPEQGISRFCCEWKVSVHKSQIGKHSIHMINSTSYKRMDKNAK